MRIKVSAVSKDFIVFSSDTKSEFGSKPGEDTPLNRKAEKKMSISAKTSGVVSKPF